MQATQASAHTDLGWQVKSLNDTDVILGVDGIIHILSFRIILMNKKPFSYMYTVHAANILLYKKSVLPPFN
jgi:hypothetical protein